MHPFINILGREIPVYGLLLVVSAGAAWLMMTMLAKKKNLYTGDVTFVFLFGVCGGIVGACTLRPLMRIVEVAASWDKFKEVPAGALISYMTGEIVFYGGFIGGFIAILLYCRKFKLKLIPILDLAAPSIALAHAVGRVGCFFGGCCYGVETPHNHPLSIVYPPASLSAPPGVPLLAVPLMESGFLLILSAALAAVFLRGGKTGACAITYLLTYPVWRFVIEFFRGDIIRGSYWLLTTSQYISAALFASGAACFLLMRVRRRACGGTGGDGV